MFGIDVATTSYFPKGYTGHHAIVAYGYNMGGGGSETAWDPENQTRFGGQHSYYGSHNATAAQGYRAVTSAGSASGQLVF